jgi:hypothetical protein
VEEFDTLHGEKVHLIIVREGLDEFAHVHPTVDRMGNLNLTHTFAVGGNYRFFADYQPAGGRPTVASGTLNVGGPSPAPAFLNPTVPGEIQQDGLQLTVETTAHGHGRGLQVNFIVRDAQRQRVTNLEPYMGELGQL